VGGVSIELSLSVIERSRIKTAMEGKQAESYQIQALTEIAPADTVLHGRLLFS